MGKNRKINIKDIRLIVYDFDGVMTDNRVIVSEDGKESVVVNRSDGLAISRIRRSGVPQLILSTESNPVVKIRAEKLDIPALSGISSKKDALINYCKKNNVELKNTLFVGNEINDLDAMKIVGYPVAPGNACRLVLKTAKFITKANGGEGVIRELLDILGLYDKETI